MKKIRKDILLLIIFIVITGLILGWVFANVLYFQDKPPKKRNEFPFKLVYEVNDERHKIEDTLVMEYQGISYGSNGKTVKWNSYLTSDADTTKDKIGAYYNFSYTLFEGWNEELGFYSIKFNVYDLEYYIYNSNSGKINAGDIYITPGDYVLTEDELYEKYGIKIIEKYISPPITEQSD